MSPLTMSPRRAAVPGSPTLDALDEAYSLARKALRLPRSDEMKYLAAQGVGVQALGAFRDGVYFSQVDAFPEMLEQEGVGIVPAAHDNAIKELEDALCRDDVDATAKAAWSLINAWSTRPVFVMGDRVRRKTGDTHQEGIILDADVTTINDARDLAAYLSAYIAGINRNHLVLIEAAK
jgi:hypothetical protein